MKTDIEQTVKTGDPLEVETLIYDSACVGDVKRLSLNLIHLLYAGAIATEGSFSLELEHIRDDAIGFDLFEALEGVISYFYHTGDMRGFLKDFGTHIYFVAQYGDPFNRKSD